jgi:hypothetical protein
VDAAAKAPLLVALPADLVVRVVPVALLAVSAAEHLRVAAAEPLDA